MEATVGLSPLPCVDQEDPAGSAEPDPLSMANRRTPRTKTASRESQHVARLGDVGQRVARVAHELNVPVSVISGSLENLEQYVGALVRYARCADVHRIHDDELAALYGELEMGYVLDNAVALLQLCRDGSQRLNHVVQQLKGYTHRGMAPMLTQTVNLARVLAEAVALVTASRAATPRIHWHIQHPVVVPGAAESLSQAFVNLLGNAYDAVHAVSEPQVWIAAERLLAEDAREWVAITIRDNGPGIPAAHRKRIFEPFYTTKSQGTGLGLGLAISKDLIEAHGGTIVAEPSQPGGATFVIRLPAGRHG